MSGLDERGKAHEKKFEQDEKLGFTVEARTSKLFGLWAAEKLGLKGADANTYAMSVVESNLDEPGFEDVLRHVRKDFAEKKLNISEATLKAELDKALATARKQIAEGK